MKIALGCDHGGLNLKAEIAEYLKSQNIKFKDFGTYSEEACDYADIALPVAEAVVAKEIDFGILICGTGKKDIFKFIDHPQLLRPANYPKGVVGKGLAIDIVKAFLGAEFEGDRHIRRINKITEIEKKYSK